MKQDSSLIIEKYTESFPVIELKKELSKQNSHTQIKGVVGSSLAFIASAIFTEKDDLQLFILKDKEQALYFFNTLENINKDTKGYKFLFYPASYKRPYQIEDTDNANVLLRTEVLNLISKNRKKSVVVSYPEALVEKVITKKTLKKNTLDIKVGDNYSIDFLNELFIEHHFEKVDYVYEPGQFSVRGGIVDVFSFSFDYPFRIEFFGDDIDSIRSFNIADQLSINTHKKITITPNVQAELLEESRCSFFQFIAGKSTIWLNSFSLAKNKVEKGFDKALYSYNQLETELKRLPPKELYINSQEFEKELNDFQLVEFGNENYFGTKTIQFQQSPQPSFNKKFDLLAQNLKENTLAEYQNFIFSDNPTQVQRLEDIFDDIEKEAEFTPVYTSIKEGFIDNNLKIVCYTDHQIFER
ncbi:MAG: transcription-repair coupling factor, partial [Flavobacteriales bacterium]